MFKNLKIGIPEDLNFSDLQLKLSPDGHVSYDHSVMKRICDACGIDVDQITEDTANEIMAGWYARHRVAGGDPDPVAEDLFQDALLEERSGQTFSLPPGEG